MSNEPVNQWATKKELVYSTLGFLAFGLFSMLVAIFMDIGPSAIIATALTFFCAGVGAAPLFYKFWFKRQD